MQVKKCHGIVYAWVCVQYYLPGAAHEGRSASALISDSRS